MASATTGILLANACWDLACAASGCSVHISMFKNVQGLHNSERRLLMALVATNGFVRLHAATDMSAGALALAAVSYLLEAVLFLGEMWHGTVAVSVSSVWTVWASLVCILFICHPPKHAKTRGDVHSSL